MLVVTCFLLGVLVTFSLAAAFGGVIFFLYGGYVVHCETTPACELTTSYAILVSILAAALVGAVQSYANRENQKKHHTINVLFESRFSQFFHDLLTEFWASLGNHGKIHLSDVRDSEKYISGNSAYKGQFELVMCVRSIANYYEFIAAAIRSGDLERELARECIGTMLVYFVRRADTFLYYRRGEISESGKMQPALRDDLYKNLLWLYREWEPYYPPEDIAIMQSFDARQLVLKLPPPSL